MTGCDRNRGLGQLDPELACAAFAASQDFSILMDERGSIEWANQAFVDLIGTAPDSVCHRPFEFFVAEEDVISLLGFASVVAQDVCGQSVLLSTKAGSVLRLMSVGRFEHAGTGWILLTGRRVEELQAEAAAKSREVASERQKANELEIAHWKLERMHDELRRTQSSLIEASRLAGMAEVATSVLHNVGNALNSINVGAEVLGDLVSVDTLTKIHKTTDLLGEQVRSSAPPVLEKALRLLNRLVVKASEEREAVQEELHCLRKKTDYIKSIVSAQQQHAKVQDVVEMVSLRDLIDEVLALRVHALGQREIEVVVEVPDFHCELVRHKVLQILTNLVSNAGDAMEDADEATLLIRGVAADSRLTLSVSDSGCGLPEGSTDRLFGHGFTTKKTGHGFGLHASANAARQMGGRLTASNDGELRGATFTLELPLRDSRASVAA